MPPPVPPPPSNEALNGTVIDPIDQWQPSTPRYGHQQVSGWLLVLWVQDLSGKEEGIGRSENEFGYEQSREMGGRWEFLLELTDWNKWQKRI